MYKLVEVVRKATIANAVDPQKTVELLQGVNFREEEGWNEPRGNTVKGLSGRGLPGNRGLLDLVACS